MACISCPGFKAVSVKGKFCSRCSHPLAKHFEGERPVVEEAPHRRPSAASIASIRDNEIKLFTDVDHSAADQQMRLSKMTPPARRLSSSQNPLANRSPMARAESRASPPPTAKAAQVERAEPEAPRGKPAPLITGLSLKERIALYSAECKSDTVPHALSPGGRGSAKTSPSVNSASSGASVPTPASVSPKPPLHSISTAKVFSFERTSPKNHVNGINLQASIEKPETVVPSHPPPVVVISSPKLRRGSLKDRIAIYTEAASTSSSGTPTKSSFWDTVPNLSSGSSNEYPKQSEAGQEGSVQVGNAEGTVQVDESLGNTSTAINQEVSSAKLNENVELKESIKKEAADNSKCEHDENLAAAPLASVAVEDMDEQEVHVEIPAAPFTTESPEKRLSIKDRVGKITEMLSTDPRFGLHDDTVDAADAAMIEESKLTHVREIDSFHCINLCTDVF